MNSLQLRLAMRAQPNPRSPIGMVVTAFAPQVVAPTGQPRSLHLPARLPSANGHSNMTVSNIIKTSRPMRPGHARAQPSSPLGIQNHSGSYSAYSTGAKVKIEPEVQSFFDPVTGTWQYVVSDPATSEAVIIDPVLDYDPTAQTIQTKNADSLLSVIETKGYHVSRILETHAHADHITAASYLQSRLAKAQGDKPLICIGRRITQVQERFAKRYGIPAAECEGVFDVLLDDSESFSIGTSICTALHLPGHTPDLIGYLVGDNIFCGDSIFHSDIGTARCDFPGGSATQLYRSGQKLLAFPDDTKIWTGHDYPSKDRQEAVPFLTVREHRERNKHLADGTSEEQYVAMRTSRDGQMREPRLIHQSLQMNIRGGRLPAPSAGRLKYTVTVGTLLMLEALTLVPCPQPATFPAVDLAELYPDVKIIVINRDPEK
ncbi:hypothetical protein S7711_03462 [Stachybotrys chartarum IBT 7711]|uniref:Metallo-beta-lactamase domain-containing protein n=1 Tax=Stachybotrys chartarum (strain CBS 109288 / IBT 7711) TaxID=1280523 RepID=A0A084AFT9_STACB|nr:hypothetical protein S7711_03462 [Stachybotrys chartarum IBT 7711]